MGSIKVELLDEHIDIVHAKSNYRLLTILRDTLKFRKTYPENVLEYLLQKKAS